MGENTQSKFDLELEKIGITLNERQKQQFDKYYEMLVEWNKVMNLTGITEYDEVNLKHFTDSLTIARTQEMQKVQSWFPGDSSEDCISASEGCTS